ncbi:Putative ketoacyl reductase [Ephemeroptericola cinctiostellae]|uniref:Ketoacyl reductase n=1 Tax=Ephemeroptericola cinctiostellae TaxID=2268024 RepID=A0A345DCA5_9BURK|nr:SDR family oxidoreductase [Ephemeroptericola cinctiostellae]AXF85993.1 Putative ketoacyl reductase [Ephemeroptericola cinctiostellae]
MNNKEQKVALVMGAASGIGAATAERLIADGYKVVIAGLPADALQLTAERLNVTGFVCNVCDQNQVESVVHDVLTHCGSIDVLVNAAGILVNDAVADIEDDVWQRQMDINLMGAMRVMRAVLPVMVQQRNGSVVNIASVAAFNAGADIASYAASKAGLVALTRSAASKYGGHGVRVNAVCPGWVDTPMSRKEMADLAVEFECTVPDAVERTVARVALGRMASPFEVAAVCSFLAGSDASFVTGAAIVVDGGARVPASARSN